MHVLLSRINTKKKRRRRRKKETGFITSESVEGRKWNNKKYSANLKDGVKREKKVRQGQSTNEVVDLNQNRSVITLNINGLNSPVKRQKSLEWFLKSDFLVFIISVKRLLMELILE